MKPGQTIEQVRCRALPGACRDLDDTMIPRLRGRYFSVYPHPRSVLCPLAAHALNRLRPVRVINFSNSSLFYRFLKNSLNIPVNQVQGGNQYQGHGCRKNQTVGHGHHHRHQRLGITANTIHRG